MHALDTSHLNSISRHFTMRKPPLPLPRCPSCLGLPQRWDSWWAGWSGGWITAVGRGGSRILRRRGSLPCRSWPTYEFAKISRKMQEIEKILSATQRCASEPSPPPTPSPSHHKSASGTGRWIREVVAS